MVELDTEEKFLDFGYYYFYLETLSSLDCAVTILSILGIFKYGGGYINQLKFIFRSLKNFATEAVVVCVVMVATLTALWSVALIILFGMDAYGYQSYIYSFIRL